MKQLASVDILGTNYTIHYDVEPKADKTLKKNKGWYSYCNSEKKSITLSTRIGGVENNKLFYAINIRHEIIHAFLYESGLDTSSGSVDSWATNEEMVDWLAMQWPKIQAIFKQLGI